MIRPLVKHPGGKRRLAPKIYEAMGRPPELCEPFAGGLAVSLTMGAKPRIIAEAIDPLRGIYEALSGDSRRFWADVDALADIESKADYYDRREAFHASPTPAGYVGMVYGCFNGLARFNQRGEFNAAVGKPLPRKMPRFSAADRDAYARTFAGCEVFDDWRPAVERARAVGVPVYADPPYVGTFAYASTRWTLDDLRELADALPVGSAISERPRMVVDLTLRRLGFEQVMSTIDHDYISRGERSPRGEGLWVKRASERQIVLI
jgi:site-specific DNA-adenine methylase